MKNKKSTMSNVRVFLLGACVSAVLLCLVNSIIVGKVTQSVFVTQNVTDVLYDVHGYYEIINDHKMEIVSSEYATILLQRRIQHMRTVNDSLLKSYPKSEKIITYHNSLSAMVDKLDEARMHVANGQVVDEEYLAEMQLDSTIINYQAAVEDGIKFWR